jgi:tetratricopeptide (TPR) repeat protein
MRALIAALKGPRGKAASKLRRPSLSLPPQLVALLTAVIFPGFVFPNAAVALPPQAPQATADASTESIRYDLVRWRERIESDGGSTFALEQQLLLRTATAVSQHGQIEVPYTDGLGDVRFENIVIEKPDGRSLEVRNGLIEDANPSGATGTSAVTGVRLKKLTIPGLEPGDRLSYRIITSEKPVAPGRIFGQRKFYPLVGDPVQTYELDLPRAAGIRVRLREGLGTSWEELPAAADRLVRRLSLKVERPNPDRKQLTKAVIQAWAEPDVMYTSFSSWAEVGQWWWVLSRDRLSPDASVKAEAARLVASKATPRERLEALHSFVASKIRYVQVSFDAGRMQPRPAAEILANRYGDCKDKHALLSALGASVGLDVRPVFINSYRSDLIDDTPGPQQFDHMISVARLGPELGDWLWLDTTNPYGVPGYLMASLRDKRALLIEDSGEGRIVRTPAEPPFLPRNKVELKGALQPDGALRARVIWRFRSDGEVPFRANWAALPQNQRAEVVRTSLARDWCSGKVTNVTASDPLDVAEPFRVEFDVEGPAPNPPAKGEWDLWVPLPDVGLPAPKESGAGATEPIELGLREVTVRAEIEIPENLNVRPPLSVSLGRPFGKYESTYAVEGKRLNLMRTLTLTRRSIPPDEVSSYEAFRKTIETDRDQKFSVVGGVTLAAAVSAESLHDEGLAAFNQKDYRKAEELLRKATETDAKVQDGFRDLGRALSEEGKNEEALKAFSRQIETDRFHEDAYAWRAYVLERLDRWDEAEKDLLKQIEVAPFKVWAYEKLAGRRLSQGRFREAADFYTRAAAIEPKKPGRWVDVGWAHARNNAAAEARTALDRARSLDPPDWMKVSAAGAYEASGDASTAGEVAASGLPELAQQLAALSPEKFGKNDLSTVGWVAEAWRLIGAAALAAGDNPKAERYLGAAWKLAFLPDAAWALGNLREKQGRLAEAVTFWSMAAYVPTAYQKLPADRQSRIEAACRRLPSAQSQAAELAHPALETKGGSVKMSENVTVLAKPSPQTEAESRLLQLRTLTLRGPVLADLTEEVLLLASPDGRVERVRNLSRKNPDAFEQQLAKVEPIRMGLTSPDERPFKAVRRGLLACSRATSCVVILDLPGMTSSASAGSVKAGGQGTLRGPWQLSQEEVSEFERKVAATPADLELRTRLLRHYMTERVPEARRARTNHVFWIIENSPEAEIAGSPETYVDKNIDSEAYERARSLWLAQLEAGGSNPKIVGNAAAFFLLSEPERARQLLQWGQKLEPVNPNWSERLAQLDMLAARRQGPEARDSARKALEEYESALSLTKDDTKRFYSLAAVAESARLAGSDEKAREYANELLRRAEELPRDWNYGNAVHEGHRILGHVELKAGNVEAAKKHLLEAGATPGSPQLNSFGPELTLASELLAKGERDAVIEYLRLISHFWKGRYEALEGWISQIREGKTPELNRFGARVSTGTTEVSHPASARPVFLEPSYKRTFGPQVVTPAGTMFHVRVVRKTEHSALHLHLCGESCDTATTVKVWAPASYAEGDELRWPVGDEGRYYLWSEDIEKGGATAARSEKVVEHRTQIVFESGAILEAWYTTP